MWPITDKSAFISLRKLFKATENFASKERFLFSPDFIVQRFYCTYMNVLQSLILADDTQYTQHSE